MYDRNEIKEIIDEIVFLKKYTLFDKQEYDEKAIKTAEDAGCTITYLTKEQSAKFQSVAEPINEKVSAKYMTIIRKIKAAQ